MGIYGSILTGLILLGALTGSAQVKSEVIFKVPDSAKVLTRDQFFKIILNHHPVVKQAALLSVMAQQEIRLARGSFDPKLNFGIDHKEFKDKTYYSKLDASLDFPTWFPVNPKIGLQQHEGELLNPEEAIPGGQQVFAGLSLPLGQGLMTDTRRTAVKQAELLKGIAEAEQLSIINKNLLEAAREYWHWCYYYYQYSLLEQGVNLANLVYEQVKLSALQGESAALDTLQAKISLQSRIIERQEALNEFINAGIALSNYFWDADGRPVQLPSTVVPQNDFDSDPSSLVLENLVEQARDKHPELLKLRGKYAQVENEVKLAREMLKPKLDLSYAALSQQIDPDFDPFNDYKVGVDFTFPVFLRKERSKLSLMKLKLNHMDYQRQQVSREIVNQINVTFNDLKNILQTLSYQDEVVSLYVNLLEAEMVNLKNGESDLFKINAQQEKLLAAQSKYVKMRTEAEKQKAMLFWAAGQALSN